MHLCAAGLGPDELHLLLIDADTTNGNINRTLKTVQAYDKVQAWPWTVQLPKNGSKISLFRTKIRVYTLTEQIESVNRGGLDAAAADTPRLDTLKSIARSGRKVRALVC